MFLNFRTIPSRMIEVALVQKLEPLCFNFLNFGLELFTPKKLKWAPTQKQKLVVPSVVLGFMTAL